jgi:DNA-binding transcriptional MocR family regulator
MILYLFLVVVGDRQGRSFYSDRSITEILRLSGPQLHHAREELISEGLISYQRPYWEVKNIPQRRDHGRDDKANNTLSSGCPKTELPPDPGPDRDLAKACLAHISRILSGQEGKEKFYSGRIPLSDRRVVQTVSDLKGPTGPRMVKNEGSQD